VSQVFFALELSFILIKLSISRNAASQKYDESDKQLPVNEAKVVFVQVSNHTLEIVLSVVVPLLRQAAFITQCV
jgi:hypothetical protein